MYCENEVRPGVLQSSPQQSYDLPKFHSARTESTHNQLHVVCAFGILAALMFNAGLKHSRFDLVFKQPRQHIKNKFSFKSILGDRFVVVPRIYSP